MEEQKQFAELVELVDAGEMVLEGLIHVPGFYELLVERLKEKQVEALDLLFNVHGFFDDPDMLACIPGLAEPLVALCLHEAKSTKWRAIALLDSLMCGLDTSSELDELPECTRRTLIQLADDDNLNAIGQSVGLNSTLTCDVLIMLQTVITGRDEEVDLSKDMLDMLLKRLRSKNTAEMISAYGLAECLLSDKPENVLQVLRDGAVTEKLVELAGQYRAGYIPNLIALLAQECPHEFLHECSTDFLGMLVRAALTQNRRGLSPSVQLITINHLLSRSENLTVLFNREGLIPMLIACLDTVDPTWGRDVACANLCHLLSARETVQLTMDRMALVRSLVHICERSALEMNRVEARRALKVVHSLQIADRVLANDQVVPFWRAAVPMWALLASRHSAGPLKRLPAELFRLVFSML